VNGHAAANLNPQVKRKKVTMIKMNLFLTRREDLTHEQLSEYYEKKHWPILASIPEVKQFVKRYVQQHNIGHVPPGATAAPYDGISEVWFDSIEDLGKVVGTEAWRNLVHKDNEELLNTLKTVFMFTEEKIN
jgi:uncharacterized protein (TIGR02118 family)